MRSLRILCIIGSAGAFSTSTPPSNTSFHQSQTLASIAAELEHSWIKHLFPETKANLERSRRMENLSDNDENRTKRPVFNGHYVPVKPTGFPDPRLVLYNPDVAELVKLSNEQMESEEMLMWLSGNTMLGPSWATPYALSIMGTRYVSNCPYGTGDGYGDGRAISIGELNGWELQIKGAGRTPFCRGGDGRAVLRSSIREFLASEAMNYLGVSTTRAISLVVSDTEKIYRPWYKEKENRLPFSLPTSAGKRDVMDRRDPDIMVEEKAAMTTRVSPSFARIGHLDLYARRAEQKSIENTKNANSRFDTTTPEWQELEAMVWHTCFREYRKEAYDPFIEDNDLAGAAETMLDLAADGLAQLTSNWIRVGFAQGNFNADNCLVAGRTMDYGPFGWVEEYHPLFAKWTGSGKHFGFMNQPSAGFANYQVLVESVVPVICASQGEEDVESVIRPFLERAQETFGQRLAENVRIKLGFDRDADVGDDLWDQLESSLLLKSRVDWTIFFRQLTYIARDMDSFQGDAEQMLQVLEGDEQENPGCGAFYEPLQQKMRSMWMKWLSEWMDMLKTSGQAKGAYERMKNANPKYILREWMLVDAYTDAGDGEEAELFSLFNILLRPYDEGSPSEERRYYRRASDESLTTGGTAFMS